ncbi:MAG: nitroreductase family protein [Phycisphaerae bacterium]|nr:nitroreductase family protein [Phycisphaerae bacterium]
MNRLATTDHPIHKILAQRWSPCGFAETPVPPEDLKSLFEAARWAASSYNEQPWRYIVATRDDPEAFDQLLSCLVEANQAWARFAPVLTLGIAKRTFSRNGAPNRVALHDLGAASASLTFEAGARGLMVHQMGGIHPEKARAAYRIPDDFEVATALAIGYPGTPSGLPAEYRQRDSTPRQRKPLRELVFAKDWGQACDRIAGSHRDSHRR